jgi:hypothetical protein
VDWSRAASPFPSRNRNHRTPATTRQSQRRRGGGPAAPELGRAHLGSVANEVRLSSDHSQWMDATSSY